MTSQEPAPPGILKISLDGISASVIGLVTQSGYCGDIIYIEIVGQPQSVKAIWSKLAGRKTEHQFTLSNNKIVQSPKDLCLMRCEKVLGSGFVDLAMIHPAATRYVTDSFDPFYRVVFAGQPDNPPSGFYDLLRVKLDIPIQREWAGRLWTEGLKKDNGTITELESHGSVSGFEICANKKIQTWGKIVRSILGHEVSQGRDDTLYALRR